MTSIEGVVLAAGFGLLICNVHGIGLHPNQQSIERHLRGTGHFCKGATLKKAVSALCELPLASEATLAVSPTVQSQPIPQVPHLTVRSGWACLLCKDSFLTTSEQLRDRHVAKLHQERASGQVKRRNLWVSCHLQTFFPKTGERRYFRVTLDSDKSTASPTRCSTSNNDQGRADNFVERS